MDAPTPSRFTDETYFSAHPWYEYLFVLSMCLGELAANAATTMAMTQMYQLQKDFHAAPPMLPWYSASFGQAMGAITLISGQIGDAYGIKAMIIGGWVWSAVWSIVCGVSYYDRSYGPQLMICARTFQGAGIAFVLPNVIGAAGRIYADGGLLKRITFGSLGFCVPLGLFLGCWFSGIIITETPRWDWSYYAFAIFSTLCALLAWISVPSLPPKCKPDGSPQRVDWIGGTLAMAGLTIFCFVWNQAPVVNWQNASMIALLPIGVAFLVAFVVYDIYWASDPIFPPYLLQNKDPRLTLVMTVTFFGWGTFGVVLFRTFMIDQAFRGYSPFLAGSTFVTMVPTGAIAAISAAWITNDKTVEIVLLFGMLCYLGSAICIATVPIEQSFWRQQFGAWILMPFALGWSYPAATLYMSDKLPPGWQGLAGSFISFASGYGIAIFLGIAGVVQGQLLLIHPDDLLHGIRGALYFAIGISGLASIIALGFVIVRWTSRFTHIPVGPLYEITHHGQHRPRKSDIESVGDDNHSRLQSGMERDDPAASNDTYSQIEGSEKSAGANASGNNRPAQDNASSVSELSTRS